MLPRLMGRETDPTETVTCHEWQRRTRTQALASRAHTYTRLCCPPFLGASSFSTVHKAPCCLQPSVLPHHLFSPRLVLSFQSWNKIPRPEPAWALLSLLLSPPSGPQFSHLYNKSMARENMGLSKSLPFSFENSNKPFFPCLSPPFFQPLIQLPHILQGQFQELPPSGSLPGFFQLP